MNDLQLDLDWLASVQQRVDDDADGAAAAGVDQAALTAALTDTVAALQS